MRKIRLIFVALAFVLAVFIFSSCAIVPDDKETASETTSETTSETVGGGTQIPDGEMSLRIIAYVNSWYGFEYKTIENSDVAEYLISQLLLMKETGEKVDKLSDKSFDFDDYDPPVEVGTFWVEYEDEIYRIDHEENAFCRVEAHYSGGDVLDASEEFISALKQAYYYYPFDYYRGKYNSGDSEIELANVYSRDSAVSVTIKSIEMADSVYDKTKIVFELVSSKDMTVELYVFSYESDDVLGGGDRVVVELKRGEAQTVEAFYDGWDKDGWHLLDIRVDNTFINLSINYPYN